MTPEIRIAGPETLPAFIALAEAQAAWLWARGIRQWEPGSIEGRRAELALKLAQGWLVAAVVPGRTGSGDAAPEIAAGCLLTRLAPPQWQGRAATAAGAAYLERLAVARAFAGRAHGGCHGFATMRAKMASTARKAGQPRRVQTVMSRR